MILDIICHSYLNSYYKILLLYFAEVKKYEGTFIDLGKEVGMSKETASKGCKFLQDEGYIEYFSNNCKNGLYVRYQGK